MEVPSDNRHQPEMSMLWLPPPQAFLMLMRHCGVAWRGPKGRVSERSESHIQATLCLYEEARAVHGGAVKERDAMVTKLPWQPQ